MTKTLRQHIAKNQHVVAALFMRAALDAKVTNEIIKTVAAGEAFMSVLTEPRALSSARTAICQQINAQLFD